VAFFKIVLVKWINAFNTIVRLFQDMTYRYQLNDESCTQNHALAVATSLSK